MHVLLVNQMTPIRDSKSQIKILYSQAIINCAKMGVQAEKLTIFFVHNHSIMKQDINVTNCSCIAYTVVKCYCAVLFGSRATFSNWLCKINCIVIDIIAKVMKVPIPKM